MSTKTKVTTKSGSSYIIDERRICNKYDADGFMVDTFKVMSLKALPGIDVYSWSEIGEMSEGEPVVGWRMYISGLNVWWITTPVVSIEKFGESENG